jgi:hypothetical protein
MPRASCRALAVAVALALPAVLHAQREQPPQPIEDNSFLIEEAYNQDAGVVQHISTFSHPTRGSGWAYSFTQEWPVRSMRHQLSAMIPVLHAASGGGSTTGVGDVALNYRYQLVGEQGGRLAIAPRLSLVLPTGSSTSGFGTGGTGVQVNIPVSVALSERFVTHSNAGLTWTHAARDATGSVAATTSFNAGQSLIWLATPTMNLMLEAAWNSTAQVSGPGQSERSNSFLVSPGVRWAYNLPHGLQIVPGLAVPIGVGPSSGERSIFTYLSFEHPF